ncbi:hypothetical protein BC936DRAFT_148053 [Jimgerdemannia flammicorona]|uniref:Uncharacterized protein n=1 Tax=Jimgerdemannia flammicorona TaxID=994334 RepID=A0A433D3W3_9FUNG|nr:hypothetical protein BC936DRAFT_148053 [Jimgerdemannia flammicorona]
MHASTKTEVCVYCLGITRFTLTTVGISPSFLPPPQPTPTFPTQLRLSNDTGKVSTRHLEKFQFSNAATTSTATLGKNGIATGVVRADDGYGCSLLLTSQELLTPDAFIHSLDIRSFKKSNEWWWCHYLSESEAIHNSFAFCSNDVQSV